MRKGTAWGCALALALAGGLALATEVEPGGGPQGDAVASLQDVRGNEATALLTLGSPSRTSVATITSLRLTDKGEILGQTGPARTVAVLSGQENTLLVKFPVEVGKENHILFRVVFSNEDGTTRESSAYLRVNLDPSREPRLVENVLEFSAAQEVKP
jgi:hypothetical protein